MKGTISAIKCKSKKCTSISSWETLNHPHPVDRFWFKICSYTGCGLNFYSVLFIPRPALSCCSCKITKM